VLTDVLKDYKLKVKAINNSVIFLVINIYLNNSYGFFNIKEVVFK
jgi:hypothetical protein